MIKGINQAIVNRAIASGSNRTAQCNHIEGGTERTPVSFEIRINQTGSNSFLCYLTESAESIIKRLGLVDGVCYSTVLLRQVESSDEATTLLNVAYYGTSPSSASYISHTYTLTVPDTIPADVSWLSKITLITTNSSNPEVPNQYSIGVQMGNNEAEQIHQPSSTPNGTLEATITLTFYPY